MLIPVDFNTGRIQFQLDFGCVPSLDIEKCRIRYFLTASDNGVASVPAPFVVLAPMQATQWQANTSRTEHREADVTCCCCCDRGKLKVDFFISKCSLSLDRDKPTVVATIDNTECEADIDEFIVMLFANGRTKMGYITTFGVTAGVAKVPANIKAGEKKTIEATINLLPTAAPSFQSAVVDIEYSIRASLGMSWAADVSANFAGIQVAHSVDPNSFNFAQMWQTTNFYNQNAIGQQPMMYQPPQNSNTTTGATNNSQGFELMPPPVFQQGPPLQFEKWEEGVKDE